MPRSFWELVSLERLRQWAKADERGDGRVILARRVLTALDAEGAAAAERAFFEPLRAYFYNMAAAAKRRHADSIALAFCESEEEADELFALMKEEGVTGSTSSPRQD